MTRSDLGDEAVVMIWESGRSPRDVDVAPVGELCVSPLDRGFQYGDGVFETLRCYDGDEVFVDRHLERLNKALDAFGFTESVSVDEFKYVIDGLIDGLGAVGDFYVKYMVTRGTQSGLLDPGEGGYTHVGLARGLNERRYSAAVAETTDVVRAPGLVSRHKTCNYLPSIQARMAVDGDEALMRDVSGGVVCGAASNLFMVRGNVVYTPSGDIREGVTREVVMELIEESPDLESKVEELGSLGGYDAGFLTNSTWGVRGLKRIDDHRFNPESDVVTGLADRYMDRVLGGQ